MTTQKIGKIILDDSNLSSDQTVNMPTNGGTLQNSGDVSSSISSHNASSGRHGATGNIVGTSDTQSLTNKDIDGGTASNSNRVTLPKNTTANLTALTRKEGTLAYSTDADVVFTDDGSKLNPLASKQDVLDNSIDKSSYYFNSANVINMPYNYSYGSSDVSILNTFKIASWDSNSGYFIKTLSGAGGLNGYFITQNAANGLSFLSRDGSASSDTTMTIPSAYNNKVINTIFIRKDNNGSTETHEGYIDGILSVSSTGKTARTWGTAVINKLGDGGFVGTHYRHIEFNYNIASFPEKLQRYSAGAKLDYEDIGGSMTELVSTNDSGKNQSTFDSGYTDGASLTWWSASPNTTTTAKLYTANYVARLLKSGGGDCYIYKSSGATVGKRYRITCQARKFTDGGDFTAKLTTDFLTNYVEVSNPNLTTNFQTYILEGIAISINSFLVGVVGSIPVNSGIELDNISIIQLGAILDLEPENITDTTWFDASRNGLNGAVTSALANRFTPSYSSRNYIINGGFDFWQRGSSIVSTSDNPGIYGADRWRFYSIMQGVGFTGSTVSQYTTSLPSGFTSALKWEITDTRVDNFQLMTRIESSNSSLLIGKKVTLSFKIKRLSTTIKSGIALNCTLQYASSADNFGSVGTEQSISPIVDISAISNTTWTDVVCNFAPLSTNVGFGIQVNINAQNGTSDLVTATGDLFAITGVQLNEGSVAAPFERAGGSVGGELALCQRYARPLVARNGSSIFDSGYNGIIISTTNCLFSTNYPSMRTIPSLTNFGTAISAIGSPSSSNAVIQIYDVISGSSLTGSLAATPISLSEVTSQMANFTVTGSGTSWATVRDTVVLTLGGLTSYILESEL
jgi:hypothetical protein